jgi:ribosomal protein S20
MAENIEFRLKVIEDRLGIVLEQNEQKAKRLGSALETAIGTFAGNVAFKAFDRLSSSITSFASDSIKAFSEQEDALNRLSQALRVSGEFSDQAVSSFEAYASQIQATTKFGDDLVLSQLALAKSIGATNDQAKLLVTAAANLSATFGGDLESNVTALGKTLSGTVGRELTKLIPELKALTAEQLRSGDAFELINSKFSGAASAELNTYSGSVAAAANAFNDLQEEIGAAIVLSLDLQSKSSTLKTVYENITNAIKSYKEEQARANGTFVETQESIDKLSEKYAAITKNIEDLETAQKNASEDAGFFESLFGGASTYEEAIKRLRAEAKALDGEIKAASARVSQAGPSTPAARDTRSEEEINRQEQLNAQIINLRQQLVAEEANIEIEAENQRINDQFARNEAELQRIQEFERQKIELDAQLKSEIAASKLSGEDLQLEQQRIALEKDLALKKSYAKLEIDLYKNAKAQEQDSIFKFKSFEEKTNRERVQDLQSTFAYIATLSDSGNKTLAAIGKAAAISNATIDGFAAVNKALASAPPPINFALAAAVGTAAAANVAKIAGVQFENGGIVGATKGPDNRVATIRDGEMVLNAEQQKTLFNAINSGTMGGDIVIQINEREIARAVRNQTRQGFKIA